MASLLTYHQPIGSVKSTNNNTPLTDAKPEKAGQTFKYGVPVQLNAGFVQQWDGTTVVGGIAGFNMTPGANLATNGAGAPGAFGQVTGTGSIQTYGGVQNTPAGVNIAVGAPITDGRTLYECSVGSTIFEATFDNSNYTNAASVTPTVAMYGTQFGLTADASGQFYVDNNKTTAGTNTVVQLVEINPIDMATGTTGVVNARVRFQVIAAARQDYI